jgi:hypothetical protein
MTERSKVSKNQRRIGDALLAVVLILAAAYLYTAIFSFSRGGASRDGFRELHYRVRELVGGKDGYVSYRVTMFAHADGRYAVYTDKDAATEKLWFDGERLFRERGETLEKLDPGLHPRSFLFDTSFGSFVLENIEDFPSARIFKDQDMKGYVCAHVVIDDPLEKDVEYEAWIDRVEGIPVRVTKRVSGVETISYELESAFDDRPAPTELVKGYAPAQLEKAQSPDDRFRVEPSSLEMRAGFSIFIPETLPSDLEAVGFFVVPLKNARRELVGSSSSGEVVVISYTSPSRFLQLYEYRGSPKRIDEKRALKETAGKNIAFIMPCTGCWWSQFTVGGVIVNAYGSLSLAEMRELVRGAIGGRQN